MADLLQTFELELEKSAREIQALLLSVEQAPSVEAARALREAYRLTHSVKGAARVVGLSSIEEIAHALEGRLQDLVRDSSRPTPAMTTAFLRVVDGFTAGLAAFQGGEDFDPEPFMTEFRGLAGGSLEREVLGSKGLLDEDAEAAAEAPSPATREAPLVVRDELLRVPTQAVDELFRRVEESFLIEARLRSIGERLDEAIERRRLDDASPVVADLERERLRLHQVLLQVNELVRSFRMEPLDRLRVGLQRVVRELAAGLGKQVAFRFTGRHELVDAATLDALQEPLLHLLRNALDHGVEAPEARRAAGKPAEATLEVAGRMRGGTLELRVGDDGRGVDLEAVRARAARDGLVEAEAAAALGEAELHELLFRPGFTTRSDVTAISGRGLGLDIVRDRLRALGGEVRLTSRPGLGATFELRVPVKLLTARVLLVRAGPHTAGLPVAAIERVVPFRADAVEVSAGQAHLRVQDVPIPVEALAGHLGWEPGRGSHVVVVGRDGAQRGYVVDEVIGEVEQPAMPAPWNLRALGFLGGVIVLGDGTVVPLVEVRDLGRDGAVAPLPARRPADERRRRGPGEKLSVLVVDDSPTLRVLHRTTLEAAGYQVEEAEDGVEALAALEARGADLVVLDIQMPNMDGLTLIRRIRQRPEWRRLPLVVVSQYGKKDDLQRAAALGADRYLVKGQFEPARLVAMVQELVD